MCEEACCPNMTRCWSSGAVTFMILGDLCTRNCAFCGVKTSARGRRVEEDEGERILEASRDLGLDHVVLTSVNRDDLEDGGADHFASCIGTLKTGLPGTIVEALVPDLDDRYLRTILKTGPEVLGHNIEVVRKLQERIRDRRAGYEKSLGVLETSKRVNPETLTKSSLMLGLGECRDDVLGAMEDLRGAGVDILTVGQYIQPMKGRAEVERYVPPEEFDFYRSRGEEMGFPAVVSGPFVRSSYGAAGAYRAARSAIHTRAWSGE